MAGERVRITDGAEAGREIEIGQELILGREGREGKLSDNVLLSRRHARIRRTASGLVIEDLASSNGTYVNGQRIEDARALAPGDTIRLGSTTLELVADAGAVAGRATTPTAVGVPLPPRPEPAPAEPPPPRAAPAAAASAPIFVPPTTSQTRGSGGGKVALFVLLALLVGAGIASAAFLVTRHTSSTSTDTVTVNGPGGGGGRVTVTQNVVSVPDATSAQIAATAYMESNIATPNGNTIMEIRFRSPDLQAVRIAQFPTGGSGSADLTDSGVLDADAQVIVNEQHTLLFAVNQGSDSIAVFHIEQGGDLTPVAGSPFDSHGSGPASLGLSNNILVVANKAQDGVRDLSDETPNYTTFKVNDDGTLTHIDSTVEADKGSSPTQAYVVPGGGVVISTEESGPIRAMTVSAGGKIANGPNSPLQPDASIFSPGYPDAKKFGLGIGANPNQKLVYINMPTVPALAVYSYDTTGKLTFIRAVPNKGDYLPCWIQVTRDGHWLYTSNATTDNVAVFDLSGDPTTPTQIQTLPLNGFGNGWQEDIDPAQHYLFVNTPRDTTAVPAGEGNVLHVLKIGADGKLTELSTSPLKLPVPDSANPQGLAVLD